MDSYGSYRDIERSPGDRTWNSRDDTRVKEERDSFYRGRSPGGSQLRFMSFPAGGPRRPPLDSPSCPFLLLFFPFPAPCPSPLILRLPSSYLYREDPPTYITF